MKQQKYNADFGIKEKATEKQKAAFIQVSDIRKFEIEMYWKRATYFWTLIASAYAGYFALLASEHIPNKEYLSFIVATIGLVFSFAWHFANRGSKYWQENWENHLDLLEDSITGPLYKTLLERKANDSTIEDWITGPLSISVSKINQFVSVFVIFTWFTLMAFSICKDFSGLALLSELNDSKAIKIIYYIAPLLISFATVFLMKSKGKTHKDEHHPKVIRRITKIDEID